jgi:hypothetical protein
VPACSHRSPLSLHEQPPTRGREQWQHGRRAPSAGRWRKQGGQGQGASSLSLRRCAHALRSAASQGGNTPLLLAAHKGHLEVARLLLEHGAEKEAKDEVRRSLTPSVAALTPCALRPRRVAIRRCYLLRARATSRSPGCCWSAAQRRGPRTQCVAASLSPTGWAHLQETPRTRN